MKQVRRVVVAQDKNNASCILQDGYVKDIDRFITGVEEAVSFNLWSTNGSPPILDVADDPTVAGIPFLPPRNGTIFRICDIPPDSYYMHRLDDILLNNEKLGEKQKALKHPLMHKVDALSYALVLEGQVTLIADENQTTLKAGDVIIDCGSHHAWSNRTDSVCRMMFVLIDAVRK